MVPASRKKRSGSLVVMLFLLSCLLLLGGGINVSPTNSELRRAMPAMIEGKSFCLVRENGAPEEVFLNGVNMGAASAGNYPGEFAIDKETYLRWFSYISQMNVQVIRVYVNQMPEFYQALLEFNHKAESPLLLIQGVYANEDMIAGYGNAFAEAFRQSFFDDILNAVDMIHGEADIEKRPGNAGGRYTADVSRWVIGWILGMEWDAAFVNGTNAAAPDRVAFSGTYVRTLDASPFEAFLAEAAETAIARDLEYGTQRPVALCNWCTTDPLSHPNEPDPEKEDGAVVDAEHILATDAFDAGFFASYHVYPYYPEFLSYDSQYLQGDDPDPYLQYLQALTGYHSMPVLISEYGIPASRGIAHVNAVTGMSQGNVSERQQGEWLIALNRDIRAAGCAGGLIFTWQDEWFKRNWNTMDYEIADRRPFWYNAQCPEECFGLLALEPGDESPAATVDGNAEEWQDDLPVIESCGLSVFARKDAGYLYLLIRGEDYDFARDTLFLPMDVAPDRGNIHTDGMRFAEGAEYLLKIHGKEDSVLTVDAAYDAFQFSYSHLHPFFDPMPGQYEQDSGCFNPIYLALNRPLYLPETGTELPFVRSESGRLFYGSVAENSLSDFCAGAGFVEIRLPWELIGFMDPSTRQVMGELFSDTQISPVVTDGVRLGVTRSGGADTVPMALYTWESWEMPEYHERLKESYGLLQNYFSGQP